MDEPRCQSFFLQPTHTLHRRYEALRAFFIDRRPLAEIAQTYGYQYGTLRNLMAQFRAACRSGQLPPFLSIRDPDDPAPTALRPHRRNPSPLPWPIAGSSSSPRGAASALASPGSSSSSLC